MTSEYWLHMARVYRAGASVQRGYVMSIERQQQADALEEMAEECIDIAVELGAARPESSAYRRHRDWQRMVNATPVDETSPLWPLGG